MDDYDPTDDDTDDVYVYDPEDPDGDHINYLPGFIPVYPVDGHYTYMASDGTQITVLAEPSTDNGFGEIPGGAVFPFAAPPGTVWIHSPGNALYEIPGYYYLFL